MPQQGWTVVEEAEPKGWTRVEETRRPKTAADVLPPNGPVSPAALARGQADARPFQYLHDVLKHVPADLLEQAKNAATGTYNLLDVVNKAIGEAQIAGGDALRETLGLNARGGSTENLQALASVPANVIEHYKQYLDPEQRALQVREHPVGTVLDLVPVSGALKGSALVAKAAPARVIDTAIGTGKAVITGNPMPILKGIAGHGPVSKAVKAAKMARTIIDEATPTAAPIGVETPEPTSTPAATVAPTPTPAQTTPAVAPKPATTFKPGEIASQLQQAAAKARVDLSPAEHVKAFRMVRDEGLSPADAVAKVGGTPRAVPAAGMQMSAAEAKEYVRLVKAGKTQAEATDTIKALRELAKVPGTMTDAERDAEIAARKGNRSPQRREGTIPATRTPAPMKAAPVAAAEAPPTAESLLGQARSIRALAARRNSPTESAALIRRAESLEQRAEAMTPKTAPVEATPEAAPVETKPLETPVTAASVEQATAPAQAEPAAATSAAASKPKATRTRAPKPAAQAAQGATKSEAVAEAVASPPAPPPAEPKVEPLTREEWLKQVGDSTETRRQAAELETKAQELWNTIKDDLYLRTKAGKVKGVNPNPSYKTTQSKIEVERLRAEANALKDRAGLQERMHSDTGSHMRPESEPPARQFAKEFGRDEARAAAAREQWNTSEAAKAAAAKASKKPAQTPAKAAEKVVAQVNRVIDTQGAKSAADVQKRVIAALNEEMLTAASAQKHGEVTIHPRKAYGGREFDVFVGDQPVVEVDRYGEMKAHYSVDDDTIKALGGKPVELGKYGARSALGKLTDDRAENYTPSQLHRLAETRVSRLLSQASGAGRVSIHIPGDGTFTIERNPTAIHEVIKRITSTGPSAWRGLVAGEKKITPKPLGPGTRVPAPRTYGNRYDELMAQAEGLRKAAARGVETERYTSIADVLEKEAASLRR